MKYLLFLLMLLAPTIAFAEPYKPSPLEWAPIKPIECSWSKLNYQQRRHCRARKAFFDKMSNKQKRKYNKEVRFRRLEYRIARLERRR